MDWACHSVRPVGLVAPGDRCARSDAPHLPSPAAGRATNSPCRILGLLPDPEGGLSDITGLYPDKFSLLPAGQRSFIQTVPQISGWRDLPPNHLRPHPHPKGRASAKASTNPPGFQPMPWLCPTLVAQDPPLHPLYSPSTPLLLPFYSPSTPLLLPLYCNRGGIQGEYRGCRGGLLGDMATGFA
jgi:hypothetical protein